MTAEIDLPRPTRRWRTYWPWALLLVLSLPAFWHDLSFPDDVDAEFPALVRPTFSRHPPPAYRLAEPGDTIDRVAIYVSSLAIVLAASGWLVDRSGRRPWLAALALGFGAFWFAANPGPTFGGWHGLGWYAIADPAAPVALRLGLLAAALSLAAIVVHAVGVRPQGWMTLWAAARARSVAGLLATGGVLVLVRVTAIPDPEPAGYWPRWAFVWALVALCTVLVRLLPRRQGPRRRALGLGIASVAVWFALVHAGISLTWYHRPLERLREVVPGRIFMSAMPTKRGLEIAHERHHFKTIINLFPEDTPFRSPRLDEELGFVSRHGLNYIRSPADVASSNDFLDQTLALARDPSAWPILVHCHGCMDRTPAWVGIFQFVVEGKPLIEAMRFIEGHRGYRPKASVTLLYNRVLPRLAPERAQSDVTAALLRQCAAGTDDPYERELKAEYEAHIAACVKARAASARSQADFMLPKDPLPRGEGARRAGEGPLLRE